MGLMFDGMLLNDYQIYSWFRSRDGSSAKPQVEKEDLCWKLSEDVESMVHFDLVSKRNRHTLAEQQDTDG